MFSTDGPDLGRSPTWNGDIVGSSTDGNEDAGIKCHPRSKAFSSNLADGNEALDASSMRNRTLSPHLTRRSHRKSRTGCFSCKSRKIKCGEEKPACINCHVKELNCHYPQTIGPTLPRGVLARQPPESQQPQLSSNPGANFTLTDMRLFHHFLTAAHPHLPAGNESVWVQEIPKLALSENHKYLMHAILALGASHLNRMSPEKEFERQAIVHRGHAIAGLNQAISRKHITQGESDPMLAACYALALQASYMDDGLADFITMVRGCALVTGKIRDEQVETVFNLQPDLDFASLEQSLSQLAYVDRELIDAGLDALECILPFLASQLELDFHAALRNVLLAFKSNARDAHVSFMRVYSVWYQLCSDTFKTFVDPSNTMAQLLLGYFIAIQLIMIPITQPIYHWPQRESGTRIEILLGIVQWTEKIFRNVPDGLQMHLHWPRSIVATVQEEIAHPDGQKRILYLPDKLEDV